MPQHLNNDFALMPGVKLCKDWRGVQHEVEVAQEGFEYNGQHFKSLSAIATKITGAKWSGPKFFGLKS